MECRVRIYLNRNDPDQRIDLEGNINLPISPFPGLEIFFDGIGGFAVDAVQYHVDTETINLRVFKDVCDSVRCAKTCEEKGFKIVLGKQRVK